MVDNIKNVNIKSEVESSYIDYAMSVIIGRALPDVRDGLKPVHRRVLYAMYKEGILPNKRFVKCAGVVGEVIKKYHPHGDQAAYDTLVRMAQDFSLRYPLVEGQGNFGSIDGDPPAAYRYTEARLSKISLTLLDELDKDTVDFIPNFDETTKEPVVLPALLPNLLINGSSGIAVGMATNIPPHNISEVIDAIVYKIENPEAQVEDLMQFIKGPDFPTGAIITGRKGIYDFYKTGRGRIVLQAKAMIEEIKNGRNAIIVTEIPYQVNKSNLIESIAKLVNKGIIQGISDIRDESNKQGIRIVIELKRDAIPKVVLNNLYKHTQMKTTYGAIMLAIDKGRPKEFDLIGVINAYIEHRKEVVYRRTEYLLHKAQNRAHILEGLKIALDNIDLIIQIIRSSKKVEEARERLEEKFGLTAVQADAILNMKLHQLTSLERINIENELKQKYEEIQNYEMILENPREILRIIVSELKELKEKYGDERKTLITESEDEVTPEDLIPKEDIVISITHTGYIKRLPADSIRSQRRGGKGSVGMKTKEDDFVEQIYTGNTHSYLLVFTSAGKCYWLKGYDIPEGTKQSKGRAIINLLPVNQDEKIRSIVMVDEFDDQHYVFMATKKGIVKKSNLELYSNPRSSGIIAIKLDEDDDLIFAGLTTGKDKVLLATKGGKSITFNEKDVRPMMRNTHGVIGIKLEKGDEVVSAEILNENDTIFTITEKGIGKRSDVKDYRVQSRAGKGIINIKVTEKSGNVVAVKQVTDEDELMIITKNGIMIRIRMDEFRTIGRYTQGVKVMNVADDDSVVSIEKVYFNEDEEES